jgi:hypothetical protein
MPWPRREQDETINHGGSLMKKNFVLIFDLRENLRPNSVRYSGGKRRSLPVSMLVNLLGWHWEFLPSFFARLVPGVDLVPFWTMAVLNVYRKWKQITLATEETGEQRPVLPKPQDFS